jgi:dTDP-4-amino-4,6-dideoxy-D-galactose acyltransferase
VNCTLVAIKRSLTKCSVLHLNNNYRLLYWKIPTSNEANNRLAAAENLFLGDTKMVYQIPAVANLSPEIKQQVHSWNQPPNEQLISLGITSGEFSRFKTDPKMPNGIFEKMYTEWVKQSVQGTMGNGIYYIGNETLIKRFCHFTISS